MRRLASVRQFEQHLSPDHDDRLPHSPPDDRDVQDPEFEVDEQLAYNLDVEHPSQR